MDEVSPNAETTVLTDVMSRQVGSHQVSGHQVSGHQVSGREAADDVEVAADRQEADYPAADDQEVDHEAAHSDELEMLPMSLKELSFVEVEPSSSLNESLEAIPDRMAFKIGTAADLVGVKPYVLRFWETEFDALRPKKSRKGQRAYSRRDVETAMIIKKLLYEDRFSIEGARARLRELRSKVKEERGVVHQLVEAQSEALTEMRAVQTELTRFRSLL